jgi:hypothetical protein
MYSPALQNMLVQAHIQELHRSRGARRARPVTAEDRKVTRHPHAARLSAYLARTVERFAGHGAPEAPAF